MYTNVHCRGMSTANALHIRALSPRGFCRERVFLAILKYIESYLDVPFPCLWRCDSGTKGQPLETRYCTRLVTHRERLVPGRAHNYLARVSPPFLPGEPCREDSSICCIFGAVDRSGIDQNVLTWWLSPFRWMPARQFGKNAPEYNIHQLRVEDGSLTTRVRNLTREIRWLIMPCCSGCHPAR